MLWWVMTGFLTLALITIAWIDLRSFRIPDWISLPLIALGLALVPSLHQTAMIDLAIGAILGFGLFWAIGSWYFRRRGIDGLGLGDAKLFAATGAWLGWQGLPMVLLIASLGGLGYALLHGRAHRTRAIAFGPWLALGFWVVWIS